MKCDLRGLLLNSASTIRRMAESHEPTAEDAYELQTEYYAASLEEVAENIAQVRERKEPLQALLDLYMLNPGDGSR